MQLRGLPRAARRLEPQTPRRAAWVRSRKLAEADRLPAALRRSARAALRQGNHGSFELLPDLASQTQLEANAVGPATRATYTHMMAIFTKFATSSSLPTSRHEHLDHALAQLLNKVWLDGWTRGEASKLYAAVLDARPECGKQGSKSLPHSKRALQGWARLEPATTRPPLPWEFAALLAWHALQAGHPAACVAIVLMFTTYIRPIEAFDLAESSLVPPNRRDEDYMLNLFPDEMPGRSKVGASNESLALDAAYAPWLGKALDLGRLGIAAAPLLKITRERFIEVWATARRAAQLQSLGYVPYQLRHGGPSHDRKENLRTPLEVKLRGRWASDRNMKRYEAAARLQAEFAKAPLVVQARAREAAVELGPALLAALRRRGAPSRGKLRPSSKSSPGAAASRKRRPPSA